MKKNDEERLMNRYGISRSNEILYHFQGHKYHKLADAVAYAKVIDDQNEKYCKSKSNDEQE